MSERDLLHKKLTELREVKKEKETEQGFRLPSSHPIIVEIRDIKEKLYSLRKE